MQGVTVFLLVSSKHLQQRPDMARCDPCCCTAAEAAPLVHGGMLGMKTPH